MTTGAPSWSWTSEMRLSWHWLISRGYASPGVEQLSARVTELRQRLTINFEQTYVALAGVLFVHLFRPDLRKACEVAAEMVARAEEQGGAEHIAEAVTNLALVRMFSGEFDLAAQDYQRGVGAAGNHREVGNRSHRAARRAGATRDVAAAVS